MIKTDNNVEQPHRQTEKEDVEQDLPKSISLNLEEEEDEDDDDDDDD